MIPEHPSEEEINVALSSLVNNDHFLVFLNTVKDMRESSIFALCDPNIIKDSNLHFVATGEVSAFDKIITLAEEYKSRRI